MKQYGAKHSEANVMTFASLMNRAVHYLRKVLREVGSTDAQ